MCFLVKNQIQNASLYQFWRYNNNHYFYIAKIKLTLKLEKIYMIMGLLIK